MQHRFASDCHNHSSCSPDGHDGVPDMLKRAKELGLYAYTLTDHCECNDPDDDPFARSGGSWEAMTAAKVPEGLRFYKGIEMGQPNQDIESADKILAAHDYDFVIGSVHHIRGAMDFYFFDYSSVSIDEINGFINTYFEELLEIIEWGNFDSLGHLTYPLRYIVGDHGIDIDISLHRSIIDKVFSELIRTGKALEVNTSGLRQRIGKTLPDLPLLTRYHELGGKLITIGSDAHSTDDLSRGIDEGLNILKQAGFRELAVFEKRSPVMLPIE